MKKKNHIDLKSEGHKKVFLVFAFQLSLVFNMILKTISFCYILILCYQIRSGLVRHNAHHLLGFVMLIISCLSTIFIFPFVILDLELASKLPYLLKIVIAVLQMTCVFPSLIPSSNIHLTVNLLCNNLSLLSKMVEAKV